MKMHEDFCLIEINVATSSLTDQQKKSGITKIRGAYAGDIRRSELQLNTQFAVSTFSFYEKRERWRAGVPVYLTACFQYHDPRRTDTKSSDSSASTPALEF